MRSFELIKLNYRSQLEEVKENLSLEIDKLERLLLLLIPSSTKKLPSMTPRLMRPRDSTVSTSPLVKRDLLSPTLSRFLRITIHSDTPSLLPPPLQKLPHFNSWLHIQDALLENSSETTESIASSSMTISQSKPSPTDKCLSF